MKANKCHQNAKVLKLVFLVFNLNNLLIWHRILLCYYVHNCIHFISMYFGP